MRRTLASSGRSIMTTETGTNHNSMIHLGYVRPGGRCMTVFTGIGGRNVRCALAGGRCSIVTAETVARYTAMIELGIGPCRGRVTVLTSV